jgi:hypothetical protein
MPDKTAISKYLEKAANFELLAQFYKYSNPNLHIHYYLKHLKNRNKAIQIMQNYPNFFLEDLSEAKVRFLHASPDTANVEVSVNGQPTANNMTYKRVTEYISLKSGKHQIEWYSTGNSHVSEELIVEPGNYYTLALIDEGLSTYLNHSEVPIGESKVRFLHLSSNSPSIDIAVKDRDVVFPNLSFKEVSDYLGLMPMTVELEVRVSGTKNVILPMPKSKFLPNTAYMVVIIGHSKEKLEILFLIE